MAKLCSSSLLSRIGDSIENLLTFPLIKFVLVIVSVMQASFGHHIFGLFGFISLAKIVSTSMTNALQSNMSPTSSRTIKICLSLVNYLMYTLVTIAVLVCLHSLTVGQWHRTGHYLNDLLIATRHTFIYGLSGILVGLFCDYNFVNFQSVLIKGQIIALISALLWWAITGQIIIYFYRVQFGSFLFHLTNDTKALMVDAVKLSIDNHKPRTFLTVSPIKLPDHKPAIRQIYYHLLAMFSMKFLEVLNTS